MYKHADVQVTDFAMDDVYEALCRRMSQEFKGRLVERVEDDSQVFTQFEVHGERMVLLQDDWSGIHLYPAAKERASPRANLLVELIGGSLKASLW